MLGIIILFVNIGKSELILPDGLCSYVVNNIMEWNIIYTNVRDYYNIRQYWKKAN